MGTLGKMAGTVLTQYRERGLLSTIAMNVSQLIGVVRGGFYRLIYFRSIKGSIFSMQGNSTIEIFNKKSKIIMGKFVFMRKNVSIRMDFGGVLQLGDYTFINDNCTINCVSKITIGRNAKIAPNVCINDHDHNYKKTGDEHLVKGEVTIGDYVWIGSNVVVLRNTTIGDHAVIAAGSVVKGNIPPGTLFLNKRENRLIPLSDDDTEGRTPVSMRESV